MNSIASYLKSDRSHQILTLYFGMILQTLCGMVTSIIIARALKPQQYGDYSYLFNLFNLFLLIVTTGHFLSLGLLLARDKNEESARELLGAGLILTFGISLVYCAAIYAFSFFQDDFFGTNLEFSLKIIAPLLILFPMQLYLENAFTGLNRITDLTVLRLMPKVIYIAATLAYLYFARLTTISALVLLLGTSYFIFIYQLVRLKPKFNNIREHLRLMTAENRSYGFHVYVGSLANVATTYLCTLSIGLFSNNVELGYYNLALSITTPLLLLPNVVATTYFKKFAVLEVIPAKLIKTTLLLMLLSYIFFVALIKPIIIFLYSADYSKSVPLTYILGFGMIVHGFGDIFNRFLCSKGKGIEIRNGAFITGIVNIVSFLFLVPMFYSIGAAITRTIIGILYASLMYFYYIRTTNKIAHFQRNEYVLRQ